MADAPRETWITGIGIVSCLGEGGDAHWQKLMEAKPSADAATFAPFVMHPIAPINFDTQIPKKGDQRQMEPWQRIGTYAAGLALDSAGVKGKPDILSRMDMIVAAGGDDHVHARENIGLAFDAGGIECKAGGIGADPLPRLHLALIALLGDLRIEIDRRDRVHHERRESRGIGARLGFHQLLPMRITAFAQTRNDADTGDPGLARRVSHRRAPRPSVQYDRPACASLRRPGHWGNRESAR